MGDPRRTLGEGLSNWKRSLRYVFLYDGRDGDNATNNSGLVYYLEECRVAVQQVGLWAFASCWLVFVATHEVGV